MITANKGEWSEIYALFKLLSDGKLFGGDANLNRIDTLVYPIIKILRHETNNLIAFQPDKDHTGFVEITNGNDTFQISVSDLNQITLFLLDELKKKQNSTFAIPEVEQFMARYKSTKIKAKSSIKSDIKIIIYDDKIGTTPELGFSIKSKIGKPSTLLNAGKTTNFVFEVKNLALNSQEIDDFNKLEFTVPIMIGRIKHLESLGASIEFSHMENKIFENNLILLDSLLPQIIASALYKYYTSSLTSVKQIIEEITTHNPMQYSLHHHHPFYEYKIKKLLCETAIGMMPATVWTGNQIDATGGYLIIKKDGDIVCYHLYHRHEFEEYLYKNTKFEAGKKAKHSYGHLFAENGKLYIALNLQIRFK
ncbi:HpaII family restriction endonuclease [Acinetobacter pittii]|uniref:HpaII family restriction endonuclease n=1 Tax=Acinetobacter pittii TaxID=48296 RepID=UPI003A865C4A